MNKPKEIELLNKHYHVDNGGYTFKINAINNGDDEYYLDGLEISNSFFGYSENTIKMTALEMIKGVDILEDLGKALIIASEKFKKL